jgi:hypothetical protein
MVKTTQGEEFEPKEKALTAWIMAALFGAGAVWVGWLLGWPWIIDLDHPDFNPMILVLGLLVLAVLWYVVQALRWTVRARAFGASQIDIDGPTPVPLGGPFTGRVRTSQPIAARGDFRLVLTCLDVHERRHMSSPANGSPHRREAFPVWTAELRLPGATDSARGLAFRFDLPASVGDRPVPPIRPTGNAFFRGSVSINIPGLRRIVTRNKPPVARYWTLVVAAPTDGTDYQAEFIVPLAEV